MSYLDDLLGPLPGVAPQSSGYTPKPGYNASPSSSYLDSVLGGPPAPEEPGWGMRALEGVGSVLGAPKRAIDYLARAGAENIYGLKQPEGATVGQMARAGFGFAPGQDANQGYANRLGGKAIEFLTDVGEDPVTWAMGGLGKTVQGGELAGSVLKHAGTEVAPEVAAALQGAVQSGRYAAPVQKAASAAFTGLMGVGALQEGSHAIDEIAQNGFTPQAAEDLLGTAASAYGAYEGGKHLTEGLRRSAPTPERRVAPEPAQEPTEAFQEAPVDPVEQRLAEQAARAQAEVAAEGPAPGVGTPGAKPWETQPVVPEPQEPAVVPEPQRAPEPALEPSLEDIVGSVEPQPAPAAAQPVRAFDAIPDHLRQTARDLAEEHAKLYFETGRPPDTALDQTLQLAGLGPYADAVKADAAWRLLSRREGAQWLEQARQHYGDEGPEGVSVYDTDQGDKVVIQRHEGRIVGGGIGREGTKHFVTGGPKVGSPVSVRPVYEALTGLGYEPSDVLSPYGDEAQAGFRTKGVAGDRGVPVGPEAALPAGAGPIPAAGVPAAPAAPGGEAPPQREPGIREKVRALGRPEPSPAQEVAPAAQEPLGAPEPALPAQEPPSPALGAPEAPQALQTPSSESQRIPVVRPEPKPAEAPEIKFSVGQGDEQAGTRAEPPDRAAVRAKLEKLFKGQRVEDAGADSASPTRPFIVHTPSGARIVVEPTGEIRFNDAAIASHGPGMKGALEAGTARVAGSMQSLGKDAWVQIVDAGKLPHEIGGHVFLDHFVSERERAFVEQEWQKRSEQEGKGRSFDEVFADDYNTWFDKRQAPSGVLGKVFQRIHDFFHKTAQALGLQTRGGLFREIESGKPFQREGAKPIPPGAVPGRGVPEPKLSAEPIPLPAPGSPPEPSEALRTAVTGSPKPPGQPPRVETKVEALRHAERLAGMDPQKLSRDKARRWKDLDPAIQKVLRNTSDEALLGKAARGNLTDVETMAVDARVRDLHERSAAAAKALEKARTLGNDEGPANALVLENALQVAAMEAAKAGRADVEGGTKIARALAARARIMEAGRSMPDQFIRKVFREIEGITDEKAADLLKVLQTDPTRLPDALSKAMQPKLLTKWLFAWKNGLVSAPGTQIANIAGNVGEQGMRLAETFTAGLIDKVVGGSRTRYTAEARAELHGAFSRLPTALGELGEALKDTAKLAPEKLDLKRALDHQVNPIGGNLGRAVGVPFRLLGSFDNFFKAVGGDAELGKLAYRKAAGELPQGSPAEITARAREIAGEALDLNSDKHTDLLEAMETARQSRTFQSSPGPMAKGLMQLRANNPWLHAVLPFLQTPANIMDLTIERSPAGFLKAKRSYASWKAAEKLGAEPATIAKLRGEAMDAIARPLVGTVILGTFTALAKGGMLTGSGPTDPKERNLLRETGWQPYSFHIGDTYVPFNRFEPVSSMLGFSADLAEVGNQKKAGDIADKALGSIVQNLTNKTYLAALADAAALYKDPMQFGSQYLQSLAGSAIPNIVAKAGQALDPTLRDTSATHTGALGLAEKVGKSVAARIPGLASTLPARESGTGEPVVRAGGEGVLGAASRFLLPVQASTERPEAILERTLVDLDLAPTQPPRDFTIPKSGGRKLRLSDEEYDVLQEGNKLASDRARRLVANAAFQRLDSEEQRRQLRSIFDRARDLQRDRLLAKREFRVRLREANP